MEKNKKSILFLIPSLSNGGAEKVAVNLANALSKDYYVTLCSFNQVSDEYFVNNAVSIVRMPELRRYSLYWLISAIHNKIMYKLETVFPKLLKYPYVPFQCLIFVKKLKKRLTPDITISMLNAPNAVNARIPGGKRIMSERNDPRRKSGMDSMINLKSYRYADTVVFQTNEVKSLYSGDIQNKGIVIRNPISVDPIKYKADSKIIISAGRLNSQKNQVMLIKAFGLFHNLHPEYKLYIYGEGPEREKLELLIKELNLDNCVFLPGFILDIHRKMAAAKMFILSSDYEGLPNVIMETMMMGLPVISTACNGSKELIADGVNGLLVPIGDTIALFKAMERLASDVELCLRLIENSRLFSQSFKTEIIVQEWKRLLE